AGALFAAADRAQHHGGSRRGSGRRDRGGARHRHDAPADPRRRRDTAGAAGLPVGLAHRHRAGGGARRGGGADRRRRARRYYVPGPVRRRARSGALGRRADHPARARRRRAARPRGRAGAEAPGMIELDQVSKRYGNATVVDDLSLAIGDGEFCVLIGSSGAGKSTALKMINQLIPPSAGTIRVDGKDAATVAPEELRRRMGYVIQSIGLFPHWTVERNVAAVPALLGWTKPRIAERTRELLTLLKLEPESFARKYPH